MEIFSNEGPFVIQMHSKLHINLINHADFEICVSGREGGVRSTGLLRFEPKA